MAQQAEPGADAPGAETAGEETAAAARPAATVGATLRAAREAAGIDLDTIAARTKIRRGILIALEEDRHDDLPALAYTLGFVKAFARSVGLDPKAMADRYRAESMKGDPVPTAVDLAPLDEQQVPGRRIAWAAGAVVILAIAGFWAWGAGLFDGPLPSEPGKAEAAPEAPPPDPAPPAAAEPPPAAGPVVLVAREEVWLRIDNRATRERFFEGTLKAGDELRIPPGEPLQLRTGRAGAIEVRVGGTVLPPLGGPVEQLRNVSLLPEDLVRREAPAAPGLPDAPRPGLPDAPLPAG